MSITATSSHGNAAIRGANEPRTTAMWLVVAAGAIDVLINAKVLSSRMIPPVAFFTILLVIFTALTVLRHRAWTDLMAGVVMALYTASSAPFVIGGFVKPLATSHELDGILVVIVGITGSIAGVAAFIEGRRGTARVPAFQSPVGETLAALVAGALIGVSYVTTVAYAEAQSATGTGVTNGVQAVPTQAPVELDVAQAHFAQKSLNLKAGGGTIYVVNKDNTEHTFDVEAKGKHYSYPVPAISTVGVVLNLEAGEYTFYCATPGHRSNGMEGKLNVS